MTIAQLDMDSFRQKFLAILGETYENKELPLLPWK